MGSGEWKEDNQLEQDLRKYIAQNLKRSEVLDFVKQDFPEYTWNPQRMPSSLWYSLHNYDTPLAEVSAAVKKELEGPGRLLGYGGMNQKWRTEHNILLPRHLVHKMMAELDPEGLEARNLQRKRKKAKGHFSSKGLLRLVSLDGHEELCGYQNSTFPLRVYGCIDSFSCKVLFLFVCYCNSNPMIIGRMYLQYLFKTEVLPIAFFPNDKNRL